MITMKRLLIAALLVTGMVAGSYKLYAGGAPGTASGPCGPGNAADCPSCEPCQSCDTPCCNS